MLKLDKRFSDYFKSKCAIIETPCMKINFRNTKLLALRVLDSIKECGHLNSGL